MINKFKKASNSRLIRWVETAGKILENRGVDIRIYVSKAYKQEYNAIID